MLELEKLVFDYDDRPLLNHVQWRLERGGLLHIKGENGAGKTTLMRLLATLFYPESGDIRFEGQSIYQNLNAYRQKFCYVGHKPALRQELTVRENLRFDVNAAHFRQALDEAIEIFALRSVLDKRCKLLSAGQKKRVSLARLAMSRQPLWLLDEPFVSLDRVSIQSLGDLIEAHRQQGGLVVLTSHQPLPADIVAAEEYCL